MKIFREFKEHTDLNIIRNGDEKQIARQQLGHYKYAVNHQATIESNHCEQPKSEDHA